MPHATTPPFPSGLRETPLIRLSLSALQNKEPATEAQLFDICRTSGFFYLDLAANSTGESLRTCADELRAVAEQAFKLDVGVKEPVLQANTRSIFGWKRSGAVARADPFGRGDQGEFWNISKDDVFQNPGCKNIAYPPPFPAAMPLLKTFMTQAHATGLLVLDALARSLGIPPDEMAKRHRPSDLAGDHVRLTWGPADRTGRADEDGAEKDRRITTFAHCDFGSVTLLFNWLGGLQIADRASGDWRWVRPLPGHAIVNLGDAMVVFSGGRLASGKHRVVQAPGAQARCERLSCVYFVRPSNETFMEDLVGGADAGGQAVRLDAKDQNAVFDTSRRWRAGDWIDKRARDMGNRFVVEGKEGQ